MNSNRYKFCSCFFSAKRTMDFSKYPFGVPIDVKNAEKINDIMNKSWKTQKSLGVGNACLIVNCVLHRCLKAIGVHANKINGVLYGVHEYNTENLKLAHVWLDIEGHVVDNTFVEEISEPLLITMKESLTYTATSVKEEEGLFLGDHVTRQRLGIDDHNVAKFEWMLLNEDKGLALSKNKPEFWQYFKMMTEYMLHKYKANVEQVSETVVTNCWGCNRSDLDLKVCGDCKIAKYCSRECQKKDRKIHSKPVCLKPNAH